MQKNSRSIFSRLGAAALCASAVALALQACGGGGGNPQDPPHDGAALSPTAHIAAGVVTGFGSVFVDGVEIEDLGASVVTEDKDGKTSVSILQMGQNIRVEHDGKGTAKRITVDAALVGAVSAIDNAAQSLTVAAQRVRINTDSSAGPITLWAGGYSSIADVHAGDLVQVHGSPVYDSTSKTYSLVATRIQKTANIASLKINGKISNLETATKTFSLNGLSVRYASASLRPTNATLSNDAPVTVYAPLSALQGNTLAASNVKLNRLQNTVAAASQAEIGGQISLYNSAAGSFEVQGVKVWVASASISPSGARLANAAYVLVHGALNADGSVTASSIAVRQQNTGTDLARVQLVGVISDFVDNSSFVVRGVPVDASAILTATACPGITLANGVGVKISANQQVDTPVVLATSLTCREVPATGIRPVDGSASNVNSAAKTFSLGNQTVQWNDQTAFVGISSDTLAGQSVRVEGYLSGSTLVARVIAAQTHSGEIDGDHFHGDDKGSDKQAWDDYHNHRRGH